MHKLLSWIQFVLVPWLGAPGVFLAAFLDSSFLSLPEINDMIVVAAAVAHPETCWRVAVMATLGSLGGCVVLWWLGRRGGEAFLVRRFGAVRVGRTRAAFERWDVLALAVPALLPPPMPFKIFVLSAGAFGVSLRRFVLTLTVARGLRYLFWTLLGLLYGEEALATLKAVDRWCAERAVLLGLVAVAVALGSVAALAWRRRSGSASAA